MRVIVSYNAASIRHVHTTAPCKQCAAPCHTRTLVMCMGMAPGLHPPLQRLTRVHTQAALSCEAASCTSRALASFALTASLLLQPVGPAHSEEVLPFCEADALSSSMRRFAASATGDSFGGGDIGGLMAYYRRLGCSEAQLNAAASQLLDEDLGGSSSRQAPATAPSDVEQTDASDLPLLMQPLPMWAYGLEITATALAAFGAWVWQGRPVGWVAQGLVDVRTSPTAGRGLFAAVNIPVGSVLGAYPGRVRSAADMALKAQAAPMAAQYCFQTSGGLYLDPTDDTGLPSAYPSPGPPWPAAIPLELAYANEPPKGKGGTNCFVEDGTDPLELLFVANRDIKRGEEIFIDYGRTYDRSSYGR